MPIRFRCVYCDKLLGIARRKAGAVVNCPHCGEKLIVPTPEPEEAAASKEGPAEEESEHARPLFERADFSALLQGEPTFRMGEPAAAVAPPPALPSTARGWKEPEPAPPPPYRPPPSVPVSAPPFFQDEAPRPPGYFLSPSKATWLSVLVVVLLALAFAGGLLVGKFLKG